MRILADENIPLLDEFFADLGNIRRVPGRGMCAADVAGADIVLVRSVTRVDAALLGAARPRFIGTATIGTDHVDTALLAGCGIPFASAPGCNAVAVAEYVSTALALHLADTGLSAADLCLAVVGYGQVGRRVAERARALGFRLLVVDPLLPGAPEGLAWVGLDEALGRADIVSLHVPLTREGPAPTWHLLDQERLSAGRWQLLINTSRGGVVDDRALAAQLESDGTRRAVLDVWEGEPEVPASLAGLAWLGTPHVAGYSQEGKWRGTAMLRAALARALGLPPGPTLESVGARLGDQASRLAWQGSLAETLLVCCPLVRDDAALRRALAEPDIGRSFDRLRRDYPVRREFGHYAITKTPREARGLLAALGFLPAGD